MSRSLLRPTSVIRAVLPPLAVGLALGVSGCGTSTTPTSSTSSPAASATSSAALTLADGWCKSTDSMPEGFKTMTGCFGTVTNPTAAAVTITGGMSPAASMVEAHETVKAADGTMKMQKAANGLTVPANGTFELKPGANHVMLMGLTQPLKIGDTVTVSLATSAGTVPVTFAVRAFTAANETYQPSGSPSMSMSHS